MCCWGFVDVELEDAPPKKKEKKEDKSGDYVLASDRLNL